MLKFAWVKTNLNTLAHILIHYTLNYVTYANLGGSALVSSRAQWAVRGKAPSPLSDRISRVESWEGDRQRDRQAHKKVAIWIDRPQGHMVESQTGWCSAAPCLCFQPQNLMRVQWNGWGWGLIESWAELFKLYSLCLALACFNKFAFLV